MEAETKSSNYKFSFALVASLIFGTAAFYKIEDIDYDGYGTIKAHQAQFIGEEDNAFTRQKVTNLKECLEYGRDQALSLNSSGIVNCFNSANDLILSANTYTSGFGGFAVEGMIEQDSIHGPKRLPDIVKKKGFLR